MNFQNPYVNMLFPQNVLLLSQYKQLLLNSYQPLILNNFLLAASAQSQPALQHLPKSTINPEPTKTTPPISREEKQPVILEKKIEIKPSPEEKSLKERSSLRRKCKLEPKPEENIVGKDFSNELREKLANLTVKYKRDWKKISNFLSAKEGVEYNPFELRKFWKEYDKPPRNKLKFTLQEDLLLVRLAREKNLNWVEIAKSFPDRKALSMRNRYYILKKNGKTKDLEDSNQKTLDELSDSASQSTKDILEEKKSDDLNERNEVISEESI